MSLSAKVNLTGRIIRDEEGLFTVIVEGPSWTTYGDALEKVLNDTPQMVIDTLRGYAEKGGLAKFLDEEFGVPANVELLTIYIRLDISQVVPSSLGVDESVTFPIQQAA